ncbi:hypothetical protein L6R52_24275 [Myxococcota bacterium]|nr:hypothetical protein [Myxococcota bacterium]
MSPHRAAKLLVLTLPALALSTGLAVVHARSGPRPAADVRDARVAEHYAALRDAPRLPALRPNTAKLREETRHVGVERVEGLIDGAVLVSRPVDATQADALAHLGVRVATRAEDVGHHTLWQGRYHRLLTLTPGGPDALTIERLTGTEVRLETALRTDRRAVLLAVRGSAR